MPTFYLNGNLVHFAAAKQHLGFYPTPSAIQRFSKELRPFKTSKVPFNFFHAIATNYAFDQLGVFIKIGASSKMFPSLLLSQLLLQAFFIITS